MNRDSVTDEAIIVPFDDDDEEYVLCQDCPDWVRCPKVEELGYCREGDEFTSEDEGCWR